MDARALQAVADASAASYRSFAEATHSVLDLLSRHLPAATVLLSHLDRPQDLHRVVDTRNGSPFALRSNVTIPLGSSYDVLMADDLAPRLCNDVDAHSVYRGAEIHAHLGARSYIGVPLELSDGSRVGALTALSHERDAFDGGDLQLVAMLARVLAYELERETNERDLRRLNESMRAQARGVAAAATVARALAAGEDARVAVCQVACEVAGGQVAFLLEARGKAFHSTAVAGASLEPVTIQPREGEPDSVAQAFSNGEPLFVPDAERHEALAPALVNATDARSALFEPVLRDGSLAGVLIVLWTSPVSELDEQVTSAMRMVATEAAVAIEHAGLKARVETLALTDPLTGLPTERVWEREMPREVARARRGDTSLCVALVDVDRMAEVNAERGDREGDLFLKEAAAAWAGQLREVDLLVRLGGDRFAVVLPNCGLEEACDVLDRVRDATPRGRTASAGVARWDAGEPWELLVARCRDALKTAKAAGRDVTLPAE